MVEVRLVTGVMLGSGVRKDQRVVDRTLEWKEIKRQWSALHSKEEGRNGRETN